MRKIILAAAFLAAPALAQSVYVQPHVEANGTYVPGHYRSAPNNTTADNWSTRGNTNPYTGQQGTRPQTEPNPFAQRRPGRAW